MAETITIEGQDYLQRNPLGVLGLSLVTLGIYFVYWYWQVNDEVRRFERDESVDPTRSVLAITIGWFILVPPFIAMYNTAQHVRAIDDRMGIQPALEPALTIVFLLFVSVGNGVYIQEHLNRIWGRAAGATPDGARPRASSPPLPPPP